MFISTIIQNAICKFLIARNCAILELSSAQNVISLFAFRVMSVTKRLTQLNVYQIFFKNNIFILISYFFSIFLQAPGYDFKGGLSSPAGLGYPFDPTMAAYPYGNG